MADRSRTETGNRGASGGRANAGDAQQERRIGPAPEPTNLEAWDARCGACGNWMAAGNGTWQRARCQNGQCNQYRRNQTVYRPKRSRNGVAQGEPIP